MMDLRTIPLIKHKMPTKLLGDRFLVEIQEGTVLSKTIIIPDEHQRKTRFHATVLMVGTGKNLEKENIKVGTRIYCDRVAGIYVDSKDDKDIRILHLSHVLLVFDK